VNRNKPGWSRFATPLDRRAFMKTDYRTQFPYNMHGAQVQRPQQPAARPIPPPRPPMGPQPKSVQAARSHPLTELKAQFMRVEIRMEPRERVKPEVWAVRKEGPWAESDFETSVRPCQYYIPVDTLAEAQGLYFNCPLCHEAGQDHLVSVGLAGRAPPDTFSKNDKGEDSRWSILAGTGFKDLQLSPSIWLKTIGGCGWHGFVGHAGVPAGEAR
jgi:hypothetical protein